jgi:hypothetical protein
MRFQGFVGPSAVDRSASVSIDRTVNLIPSLADSGSPLARTVYHSCPGLSTFTTLSASPVRGLWAGDSRLFAAAGTKLYEVNSNGTSTELGTIADDAAHSPVQIFANGSQLFVVSAGLAYIHDGVSLRLLTCTAYSDLAISATDATKITSEEFPFTIGDIGSYINVTGGTGFTVQQVQITAVSADHVATCNKAVGATGSTAGTGAMPLDAGTGAFMDGYYIAAKPNSKRFQISYPWDGNLWDPIDYAIKEGDAFNIAAIIADHQELWIFGTQSTEVWVNTGNADFPFERRAGALIEQGCWAPWSVAKCDNSLIWLGGDPRGVGMVWRAQGYTPTRISSHALEYALQSYSTISDAVAYSYQEDGHSFYVLTFPTADATWVWDASTGLWHERARWDGSAYHAHRARSHAYIWNKHLVGDSLSGKIYEQSLDIYDDDGAAKRWLRVAPHIAEEQKRLIYSRLQIDLEVGVGTATVPAPVIGMKFSDDGGHTWSAERTASMGAAGDYKAEAFWWRLGSAKDRVFQVYGQSAVKTAIVDAFLEVRAAR